MVSTNIQFSTNNELLKALSEAKKYEEEISKYIKLLEKAKQVIKEHSPDKLGTYHYRINSKIRATDYVTYKYMFNIKKFKKDKPKMYLEYFENVPIHTVKIG